MSLILTYCRFELSPKALLCSLPSGAVYGRTFEGVETIIRVTRQNKATVVTV